MLVVYIAGPYGDAGGYLSIDRNIARARSAAAWLARNEIGYYCPHLNSAHFEAIVPDVPVSFWYAMDLALMPIADALLVLDGWQNSTGTQAEILEWAKTGKPMFYDEDDRELLLDWANP